MAEEKIITEWKPGEKMSKEFALDAIEVLKQFCRRLYFQPQMKPFNGSEDFEATTQVLNGLKELIDVSVTE